MKNKILWERLIQYPIIDKSYVWYGSINILGYPSEEDNIIKVADSNLANELINELYKCFP